MDLIGSWNLGDMDICRRLPEARPSVIVIADENMGSQAAAELTRTILEQYPELVVIRTGLSENVFRIFSTHTLPARGADLLETIRGCMERKQGAGQPGES
jgi:hypothetical protein